MVAGCQTIRTTAYVIQQKANDFLTSVCSVETVDLNLTYTLCDDVTVEIMLVCKLGLEGLDSLRSSLQAIPEAFLENRVPLVTSMVNEVLSASGRRFIDETQCDMLISMCMNKCKRYMKRNSNPKCFDDDLLNLTTKTGIGYGNSLLPCNVLSQCKL